MNDVMDKPASENKNTEKTLTDKRAELYRQRISTFNLYLVLSFSAVAIFLADYLSARGVSVWIFYIFPLTVSLLAWRPAVPLIVATGTTILMVLGFFLDSAGYISSDVAQINRGMGIFNIWVMATVGFFFIRNKVAVRRDEWIQTGLTHLSARIVGEATLEELSNKILTHLATYTNACAGAIYYEDGAKFKKGATYGVPDKSIPKSFTLGDGLLGQAVKDNRSFFIQDVPDGYLSYGSAFGYAKPKQLLICPMTADGEVNAVIELGFDKIQDETVQELLERTSEAIGIALRTANYRLHLQNLLEETQRQAEEMEAQGEELRVSNEELEEQSNALLESQSRLEQQQAELEQTNAQLEEQTQLLESQRDELEQTKSNLQLRARELSQASQYKSDFLANMSHELRTPLNSTLILAKLLADNNEDNLTPDQVKYAETIQSSGNDLLILINDILDLSKIEAGHMEMQIEAVNPKNIVEGLTAAFEPQANEKNIEYETEFKGSLPKFMETDSQRIEQVLKNLLSNALKFTEEGKVTLSVQRRSDKNIAFSVTDTGVGIPDNKKELIFQAFHQADGTTSRKFGGTGLGLSISRELTRLLGGTLEVESKEGEGSTFTLIVPEKYAPEKVKPRRIEQIKENTEKSTIPRTVSEDGEDDDTSSKEGSGKSSAASAGKRKRDKNEELSVFAEGFDDDRHDLDGSKNTILIVEDDEAFSRILYDLAHELNFQCLLANTAEQGWKDCLEYRPDAVVLDIGLPDHSGLSVLDRVKSDSRTRHIPVHVVSAEDMSHTAYSLGAIGYMMKPVKRDQLASALKDMETKFTRHMRQLLIVEDDPVQLESLQKLLEGQDVQTTGVSTAKQCLKLLKNETFDCMVMDLSLPDASGYDLLETLSREDGYSFPPVIVYTGRDLSSNEEQKLKKYSRSIIIKGAKSPERLFDEVSLFLHQVVADLPDEHQKIIRKAKNRDSILEGRNIMIVEDDMRNVYSLTSILEPRGAKLQIARNGKEALKMLEQSRDNDSDKIDLVLMDVMMPEMDGITATRELRKEKHWKNLPIIMLTAKAMKDDQKRCLDAGANDYMAKPLDVEKLLSLVRVWMPR